MKRYYEGRLLGVQTRGFTLVAVLFIMIVVGALLIFLLRTGAQSQLTSALQLQEARAFQSAQAGLEWGIYEVKGGVCPASPTTFSPSADLSAFNVRVSCTSRTYTEQGNTITLFELDALAQTGTFGGPDYVGRRVQLTVEGP